MTNNNRFALMIHRLRWWIVGLLLVSVIPASYCALRALETNVNKVADWLPTTTPEMREFAWFCETFEGDEILVVTWDGCTVDDPRLDALAEAVVRPLPGLDGSEQVWFSWARTGRSVLRELTAEPLLLSREEALQRMANWAVGSDGRTSCAILKVNDAGRDDRHSAVAAMKSAARRDCNLSDLDLRLGGSTFDCVAIDDESQRSIRGVLAVSLAVGVIGSFVLLRNVRFVCLILLSAGLCEVWSLAIVWIFGSNVDLVLVMMPVLIGILAVSASIHMLNYYTNECVLRGTDGAAARAVRRSWKPAMFSCITTSLGLISLLVSEVAPVRKFGVFSAVGVGLSLIILYLFLPAALECWPGSNRGVLPVAVDDRRQDRRRYRRSWARWFARQSVRRYGTILAVTAVATPLLFFGTMRIRTSIKLQDMFDPRSTLIANYRRIEADIGPLVPVEVVVRFRKASPSKLAERLRLVEQIRGEIDAIDKVGGTISAATFAPPLPVGSGVRQTAERRIILWKLEKAKPRIIAMHYLATTGDEELWRISARVETFNDLDYGIFLDQLRSVVDPIITTADRKLGEDVRAIVTGGIPTFYVVQRRLLDDLRAGFGVAFLTIAFVLSISLRSVWAGLVTMIPNVLPVLVVFGYMGWSDIVVDLGSMLTISTALGISVDNELHFFNWFRTALNRGYGRRRALLTAYRRCGPSMAQTAVICSLGMLVFTLSPFTPISRFGCLMSTLIALAMLGDQLLLPALLVSPLGSFFRGGRRGTEDAESRSASRLRLTTEAPVVTPCTVRI
jgi:predicted RND superfamily exporter protein